jgi:hypothetical protein
VTTDGLLVVMRTLNIDLAVDGDQLVVDAPDGALTDDLTQEITAHKPALMTLLAPVTDYVRLKGGLTVPGPALTLAVDLEARGFQLRVDADQQFQVAPTAALTAADRAGIARWRLHLAAIVEYECPAAEWPQ